MPHKVQSSSVSKVVTPAPVTPRPRAKSSPSLHMPGLSSEGRGALRPPTKVGVGAQSSLLSTQMRALSNNPFAVLADVEGVDKALKSAELARDKQLAPRGYTVPKSPIFGTDIPIGQDGAAILGRALEAGYRTFDAATSYESLGTLVAAAQKQGVDPAELYVVYKVKPADDQAILTGIRKGDAQAIQAKDGMVSAQLQGAQKTLGRLPDVLMLHELSENPQANEKTLSQLAKKVKNGEAKAIGVSNVGLDDLIRLNEQAKKLGCPIKCVENRFSPYHRDADVRRYCEANNIRYVAYGLMGSAQKGACVGEGWGSPTQYLLARKDPRLTALADKVGVSPGELLIAWADQKGIAPVAFSTDPDRIAQNLAAKKHPKVTPEVIGILDGMFAKLTPSAKDSLEKSAQPAALKDLYRAVPDPTAWHVLDTLTSNKDIQTLLAGTAQRVSAAAGFGEQEAALRNFGHNLLRHVADLQSAGMDDWREAFLGSLGEVAEAATHRPEVQSRFEAWANKNSQKGGGFVDSVATFPAMLAPLEAADLPGQRTLDLSEGWKVMTESFSAEVHDIQPNQPYGFYRNKDDNAEFFTGTLLSAAGTKLKIAVDE